MLVNIACVFRNLDEVLPLTTLLESLIVKKINKLFVIGVMLASLMLNNDDVLINLSNTSLY